MSIRQLPQRNLIEELWKTIHQYMLHIFDDFFHDLSSQNWNTTFDRSPTGQSRKEMEGWQFTQDGWRNEVRFLLGSLLLVRRGVLIVNP